MSAETKMTDTTVWVLKVKRRKTFEKIERLERMKERLDCKLEVCRDIIKHIELDLGGNLSRPYPKNAKLIDELDLEEVDDEE